MACSNEGTPSHPLPTAAGPESMAEPQPDKASWPELVGKTGDEAAAVIRAERPDLKVRAAPRAALRAPASWQWRAWCAGCCCSGAGMQCMRRARLLRSAELGMWGCGLAAPLCRCRCCPLGPWRRQTSGRCHGGGHVTEACDGGRGRQLWLVRASLRLCGPAPSPVLGLPAGVPPPQDRPRAHQPGRGRQGGAAAPDWLSGLRGPCAPAPLLCV